jgi:hypothetical protein
LISRLCYGIITLTPAAQEIIHSGKQLHIKKIHDTTTNNKMSDNKQVRFGDLTIREYPMELGEHPSCSAGAPVQLGWKPQSVSKRNLDLYEYVRGERPRRGRKELAIPLQIRGKILLQAGYSPEEIGNAAMEVAKIKKLRSDTLKNQGWDRANIILETTGKLPRGIVNGLASLVVKPTQNTVQARSA